MQRPVSGLSSRHSACSGSVVPREAVVNAMFTTALSKAPLGLTLCASQPSWDSYVGVLYTGPCGICFVSFKND